MFNTGAISDAHTNCPNGQGGISTADRRKKTGCGNIRAFGNTSEQRKHIKLPKRAQIQLRYLKRRLIAGYGASRYTLEFVRECFMEFPALVKA